jgi:hypothetical protein
VEIHKIEELELVRTEGIDSVTGRTGGNGKLWYEFEVLFFFYFFFFFFFCFGRGQLSCMNRLLTLPILLVVSW